MSWKLDKNKKNTHTKIVHFSYIFVQQKLEVDRALCSTLVYHAKKRLRRTRRTLCTYSFERSILGSGLARCWGDATYFSTILDASWCKETKNEGGLCTDDERLDIRCYLIILIHLRSARWVGYNRSVEDKRFWYNFFEITPSPQSPLFFHFYLLLQSTRNSFILIIF